MMRIESNKIAYELIGSLGKSKWFHDYDHKNIAVIYLFMVIALKNENKIYVQVAHKMVE
jgi:hypothetical protein